MGRQSWKLRSLGPGAGEVVRNAPSQREAAKRLKVNVSTVSRRVKAGRWPAPGEPVRQRAATVTAPVDDSATFAVWARATFNLTRAELELVDLGQQALDVARDSAAAPSVRLQAMTQFRACLRDLKLPSESEQHGDVQKSPATATRPNPWRQLA